MEGRPDSRVVPLLLLLLLLLALVRAGVRLLGSVAGRRTTIRAKPLFREQWRRLHARQARHAGMPASRARSPTSRHPLAELRSRTGRSLQREHDPSARVRARERRLEVHLPEVAHLLAVHPLAAARALELRDEVLRRGGEREPVARVSRGERQTREERLAVAREPGEHVRVVEAHEAERGRETTLTLVRPRALRLALVALVVLLPAHLGPSAEVVEPG